MKNKIFLLLVLATSLFLRFYSIGSLPAINADEAALGYNAYSLIKTGMDEHGRSWPVHFQSFNDWKPGLTVYLMIPAIYIFGLNEFSTRFVPVLLSSLAPIILYFFVIELSRNKLGETKNRLALISSFFLAISPWHIHFSRGAWEVSVAMTFILLGSLFYLKGLVKPKYYLLSGLFFVLSMYTYHSARVFVPLFVFLLTILNFRRVLLSWRYVGIASMFSLFLLIPLFNSFVTTPAVLARASGVGLFSDIGPINRANELRGSHEDQNNVLVKLFNNKYVEYGLAFANNYGAHFHGLFLFLSGDDIQRNKVPETGQMYIYDLFFIPIGLVLLSKRPKKYFPIIVWLFISPLAAALTFQTPHALRAMFMVLPLVVISAMGLEYMLAKVDSKGRAFYFSVISLVLISVSYFFTRYILMYYGHMSKEYPYSSQYGLKELAEFLKENRDYSEIIVTDRYDQPYILLLYYLKYEPSDFQNEVQLTTPDGFGFSTVRRFSNFNFVSIDFEKFVDTKKSALLVGTPNEIPETANIIKRIYGTNGYEYFRIVEN